MLSTIEEYSIWGGVPRYWELREEYSCLKDAIRGMLLGPTTVLYDEPKKLFLDDMKVTVQSESLMAVIAGGANRLSEIASRMRQPPFPRRWTNSYRCRMSAGRYLMGKARKNQNAGYIV